MFLHVFKGLQARVDLVAFSLISFPTVVISVSSLWKQRCCRGNHSKECICPEVPSFIRSCHNVLVVACSRLLVLEFSLPQHLCTNSGEPLMFFSSAVRLCCVSHVKKQIPNFLIRYLSVHFVIGFKKFFRRGTPKVGYHLLSLSPQIITIFFSASVSGHACLYLPVD